jgi:2Fe-2S ferredoxin
MPSVTFILPDGSRHSVSADGCATLMHAAIRHTVPGIEAECGGLLSCATCQVYVEPEWQAVLPPAGEDEQDIIADLAVERRPESRLACQVLLTPGSDGLSVRVPPRQR